MKKHLCVTLAVLACLASSSQPFSINASSGIINYAGDLRLKGLYLQQAGPVFSVGGSYYFLPNFAANLTFTGANVGADDQKGGIPGRNLNFKTNIFETAFTIHGDLVSFMDPFTRWSPYAFAGVGVFHFNPYTYASDGEKVFLQPLSTEGQGLQQYPDKAPYSLWAVSIPFGIGAKYALSTTVSVGADFEYKKIFTDYIDDVSGLWFADTTLLYNTRGPVLPNFLSGPMKLKTLIIHFRRKEAILKRTMHCIPFKLK